MDNLPFTLKDPLQYGRKLRFPRDMERAYREDYAGRAVRIQRHFIAFGFVLYGLFGILDYFAMPRTHLSAWLFRALFEPFAVLLFAATFQSSFRGKMCWLLDLWTLGMNITILGMIAISRPAEPAYSLYPIGLMLVMISGYVSSGHLWYGSLQGWLVVGGYLIVGIQFQDVLSTHGSTLQFFTMNFFLIGMNLIGMMLGYGLERTNRLAFLQRIVIEGQHREAEELRAESDRLLLNILPDSVAERLKHAEPVTDRFDQASILFADIVNFTPYSADRSPAEVVVLLNRVFSAFDELSEKYGLEKIKTIGDAYMVASGLPIPRPNHLEALVEMALEMQAVMQTFRRNGMCSLDLRIGINTGPVIAGIIGFKKFSYDLWGDTVNVASRMESSGCPGRIQVTEEIHQKLRDRYIFEERGSISVKGRGEMVVYFLMGRREAADAGTEVQILDDLPVGDGRMISLPVGLPS